MKEVKHIKRNDFSGKNGRDLNEHQSVISLIRKGAKVTGKTIDLGDSERYGNKSWGACSFLVNWCGYDIQYSVV